MLILAGAGLTAGSQATFRAIADLVVVDVAVLDRAGNSVGTLTAGDFTVTVRGEPRRIVSLEYVSAPRLRPSFPELAAFGAGGIPGPVSNRTAAPGRSVFFVVDVEGIRAGEGRAAIRGISNFVAALGPADLAGLVALPAGSPRVDLSLARRPLAEAASGIVGLSRRLGSSEMTPGEALAIADGDPVVLGDYYERTAGLPRGPSVGGGSACGSPGRLVERPPAVPQRCRIAAEQALDVYRRHARTTLESLRVLAGTMAPLDGPKALVLVSEGLFIDSDVQDDLRMLATVAERSRVSVYGLHLETPEVEATTAGGGTATARRLDDLAGFSGMAAVSLMTRGAAFRVVGDSGPALERLDRELSGYYLLAFERHPADRDGEHIAIVVGATSPDLVVRARREFRPMAVSAAARSGRRTPADVGERRAVLGDLLHWPAPISDLEMVVDSFPQPVARQALDVRLLVAVEVKTESDSIDIGVEVTGAGGGVVADAFVPSAEVVRLRDGRKHYLVEFMVPPGLHTVRAAAVDGDARRGAVSQVLTVDKCSGGSLCMSGVVTGVVEDRMFIPAVRVLRGTPAAIRVEVHAEREDDFTDAVLEVDLLHGDGSPLLMSLDARLAKGADPLSQVATTVVDLREVQPGDYVVRVALVRAGQTVGRAARRLRVN